MRYHTLTGDLIRASGEKARLLGHSYVGTVHLLLALLEQPGQTQLLLRGLGMEPGLAQVLAQLLCGAGTPDLPLPQGFTPKARELLHCAAREARSRGTREMSIYCSLWPERRERRLCGFWKSLESAGMGCLPIRWNGCGGGKAPLPGEKRRRSQRNCWSSSVRT